MAFDINDPTTWGGLLTTGAGLVGNYLGGQAVNNTGDQTAALAQQSKFQPFGMTTAFGNSAFSYDANGNLNNAGYQLSPGMQQQRDALFGGSNGLLSQFTGSPQATQGMATGANASMNLGNQYLGTSPQAQAQKYMADQQSLLAPGRERDLAQLQNQLQAQGRLGLSMGATQDGSQAAANPVMQAYFNSLRQQDNTLAANATQGGMDYAKFGGQMVDNGGGLLRTMYQTQAGAFDPYTKAVAGAQNLENMGAGALDLSTKLGSTAAGINANANNMAVGGLAQQNYNPWAGLLSGFGNQGTTMTPTSAWS